VTYNLILSIIKNTIKSSLLTIFYGFDNHTNCYLTTTHVLGPFYSYFSVLRNSNFLVNKVSIVNLTNRLLCVWGTIISDFRYTVPVHSKDLLNGNEKQNAKTRKIRSKITWKIRLNNPI